MKVHSITRVEENEPLKKKSFLIQHEFCIDGHDVQLQNSLQW